MLDLGTSFLASVARDPEALAIVDGDVRLSYSAWYGKISALVAGLDALGLKPGDHLVTVLQNRWEAATIHWACQFAGIIVTPLNWRSTAEELDFYLQDAEAKVILYEEVSAAVVEAFQPEIERALVQPADFKSALQERLARRGTVVTYEVTAEDGPPHERTFEVAAMVDGEVVARGSGRSKKDAEQAAAEAALEFPEALN